jgi:hypothetical protein
VKGIPVISADQHQNIVWQLPHNIFLEDVIRAKKIPHHF